MEVSVVIPCFNAEKFLERSVSSVLNQTFKPKEIICVNDGSTDNTLSLLKSIQKRENIIVIDQINKGASNARNNGLKAASGEYIQFLDADDEILEKKLASQVNNLDSEMSFIVGAYTKKFANGIQGEFIPASNHLFYQLFTGRLGNTPSNLWNRRKLMEIGGWDETLKSSQEFDLMCRLIMKFGSTSIKIDKNPFTLVHEQLTGSISSNSDGNNWKRLMDLRWKYITLFQKIVSESDLEDILQAFFLMIRYCYKTDKLLALNYNSKLKDNFPQFTPRRNPDIGKLYITLHKLFGFKFVEKLASLKK